MPHRDFDQAAAQLESITFQVAGRTYTLPPDPPMAIILKFTHTDWDHATVTDVIDFMSGCFGQAVVDQMGTDGVGFVTFCKVANWMLDTYGMTSGMNAPVQSDPKAQPPRRVRRAKPTAATAKPKRPRGSVSPRKPSSKTGS
jgi:hypothetical protein